MKLLKYSILGITIAEIIFWVIVVSLYFFLGEFAPHLEWTKGPWGIYLVAFPLASLAYLIDLRWKIRATEQLADNDLFPALFKGFSAGRQTRKFILWRIGAAFLFFGILGPKVGSKLVEVESKGSDIIIAIDVSNSMLSEDLGIARIEVAKQTVLRTLSKLGSDRVGLVVFAGEAYVQCPLTSDYSSLKIFLNSVNTDLIATQGTALGNAIDVSVKAFENAPENGRSIIILTDGENHEDDAVAAASRAQSEGITVHILGLATPEGGPVPKLSSNGKKIGFIEDINGSPVVSRLDEPSLIATAQASGGLFSRSNKSYVNLDPVLDALAQTEKTANSDIRYTDYDHKFQIFLLISIFLLSLEALIPNTLRR